MFPLQSQDAFKVKGKYWEVQKEHAQLYNPIETLQLLSTFKEVLRYPEVNKRFL